MLDFCERYYKMLGNFFVMHAFLLDLGNWVRSHLVQEGWDNVVFDFLPTQQSIHGDFTTSAAFVIAKQYGLSPVVAAQRICDHAKRFPGIAQAQIAKGGFANITVDTEMWNVWAKNILEHEITYGQHPSKGIEVNVEYVSANPTGPLHAGHGRCAVMGDILANILEAAGYSVTREYYVNDAGHQISVLARSVYKAYMEYLGNTYHDEESYPGKYIQDIGSAIAKQDETRWVNTSQSTWETYFGSYAVRHILTLIQEDLNALGICHDVFTCERFLHQNGLVQDTFNRLQEKGLVYEGVLDAPKIDYPTTSTSPTLLSLLRTTSWGDIQDRSLRKQDGTWTYFSADLAYHVDKILRGFALCIDVWGADHIGHVTRLKGAIEALEGSEPEVEIICCQMVRFFSEGSPIKMSKRSGNFVTIQDLLQYVDAETLRFFMINKKADTHFDLDIEEMKSCTKDNPIFYIQYAHARCCSVLRHGKELFTQTQNQDWWRDINITSWGEMYREGIKIVSDFPRIISNAALSREPHILCTWLYKIAQHFHGVWQKGSQNTALRFLDKEDKARSLENLVWVQSIAIAIRKGLQILGIHAKEEL